MLPELGKFKFRTAGVQPSISSTLNARTFFLRTSFWQLFYVNRYVHTKKKAAKTTFVQNANVNVDEIDTWCQFHQCSTYNFCARGSRKCKKIQLSQQCLLTLLGSSSIKAAHRTLMKLTLGFHVKLQ